MPVYAYGFYFVCCKIYRFRYILKYTIKFGENLWKPMIFTTRQRIFGMSTLNSQWRPLTSGMNLIWSGFEFVVFCLDSHDFLLKKLSEIAYLQIYALLLITWDCASHGWKMLAEKQQNMVTTPLLHHFLEFRRRLMKNYEEKNWDRFWSQFFLYKENHSLYEWFQTVKKAYGEEQENPVTIIERSANCTIVYNRDSLSWE